MSNLSKASTSKIGPELDLALETGRVGVSLKRSVREERFAHVRLVGAWGGWSSGGGLGGAGLGGGAGQRVAFKHDPRALREAVFDGAAGAAGAVNRRKVERAVEEGGEHAKDRGKQRRRSKGGRTSSCLLRMSLMSASCLFIAVFGRASAAHQHG